MAKKDQAWKNQIVGYDLLSDFEKGRLDAFREVRRGLRKKRNAATKDWLDGVDHSQPGFQRIDTIFDIIRMMEDMCDEVRGF